MTTTRTNEKNKLIEIIAEGMDDRAILCQPMKCLCGRYDPKEALEFFTPVILALGLSLDDFARFRDYERPVRPARKSKSIEELKRELDEVIAGIKSSLGLSN